MAKSKEMKYRLLINLLFAEIREPLLKNFTKRFDESNSELILCQI